MVLQLCGSDRISPNLRSFYFRAPSPPSADLWTDAFLSGRHDSLLESLSAFKDLQGGYSKQLNACNEIAIQAEARGKESRDECYRVRQNAEGNRGEVKKGALEVVKVIGAIGGGGDDKEGGQEGQREAVKRVMKLSREGDVAGVMEVILERVRGQREELEKSKEVAYELRFEVTEGRAERELEVAEVKKRAEENVAEEKAKRVKAEEEVGVMNERVRSIERERDALALEFQMLGGQKEKVDRRRREAGEHKKILVREVIAQRGKIEYYAERNRLLEASVDRKKEGMKGLREQVRELKEKLEGKERLLQAMVTERQTSQGSATLNHKIGGGDISQTIQGSMSSLSTPSASFEPPVVSTTTLPPSSPSSSDADSIDAALDDHDLQDRARHSVSVAATGALPTLPPPTPVTTGTTAQDIIDGSDDDNDSTLPTNLLPTLHKTLPSSEKISCLSPNGKKSSSFYGNAAARKLGEDKGWETNKAVNDAEELPKRIVQQGIVRISSYGCSGGRGGGGGRGSGGGGVPQRSLSNLSLSDVREQTNQGGREIMHMTKEEYESLTVAAKSRLQAEGKYIELEERNCKHKE